MRAVQIIATLALAGGLSATAAIAADNSTDALGIPYTAGDLLSPCQEADNDARWGEAAETECEQYVMGFVGALRAVGAKESMGQRCLG